AQPVRLERRGHELHELDEGYKDWNAQIEDEGGLVPAVARICPPGTVPRVTCRVLCFPCCVTTASETVAPGLSSEPTLVRSSTVGVALPLSDLITPPASRPAFAAGPPRVTLWTRTPSPFVSPISTPR